MTSAKKFVLVIAIVLVAGIGLVCLSARLDITQSYYEGYEDAQIGIEVGWLPAWLPQSATSIRESHNIDTDESFATFEFAPTGRFYAGCQQVTVGNLIFPRPEQRKRYPDFVTESLRRIHDDHTLKFFRCVERHTRVLAVDSASGLAYVWWDRF